MRPGKEASQRERPLRNHRPSSRTLTVYDGFAQRRLGASGPKTIGKSDAGVNCLSRRFFLVPAEVAQPYFHTHEDGVRILRGRSTSGGT